jgi:hypothetical protein
LKTIPATLDLDKAHEAFREDIKPAMEIGDVSNWDGPTLLKREAQIVQAALVLAGQCIALLLYNLVECKLAQAEARKRTYGLRKKGSQGHGKRPIRVRTFGSVEVKVRVQYVFERRSGGKKQKRGQRKKENGQGFYPMLKWLGIEEQLTPLVWATTAEQGLLSVSFEAARSALGLMGIFMSASRVERLTYSFAQIGLNLRQNYLNQLERGELKPGQTLAGQRVVISVDGGRSRIRRPKRGRRRQKTGRHGYYNEWKEPKLLTIYAVDEQGKKIATLDIPITNDGTFGDVEEFMPILEMHLVRLGVHLAEQVLLLADGASWIWDRIPALLQRLGCPQEKIITLFDFYHATQHLHAFAQAAFSDPKAVKAWFKKARSALKRGQVDTLIKKMENLCAQAKGKRQETMADKLEFFTKRPDKFNYGHVAALKLPIGSGSIESLIRRVVNLRLKSAGKSWLKENAERVLHARCQWAAGTWDAFRVSILTAYLSPT